MIILSGGISSGRDIFAAQIMGADLVYMGTRFIATNESLADTEYEEMLIEATLEDLIYTDAFSGVSANYLIPSIRRAGLDPDQLQKKENFNWSESRKMSQNLGKTFGLQGKVWEQYKRSNEWLIS